MPALLPPRIAAMLLSAVAGAAAAPQHAHQHGVVAIDAAIDGRHLDLTLHAPLDTLLGFERPPHGTAEQRAAQSLIERLRRDAALVQPDAAAGCECHGVELRSSALGLGEASPDVAGHAEIEVRWRFLCAAPQALKHVELGLTAAFPRIRRVEARIAVAGAQSKQVLHPPARRLVWPR